MMTTTPYDARRAARIREAYEAVYHLGHVVKDYPNVRKDGFGTSHLARVEKLLADTAETVAAMIDAERKQMSEDRVVMGMDGSPGDTQVVTAMKVVGEAGPELVRIVEPTVPVSLIDQIRTRTDCD